MPVRLSLGVVTFALVACSSSTSTPTVAACDVDALAARYAGSEAIDCGHIAAGKDPRPAWACAVEAFRSNRPFRLREDTTGIDSTQSNATTRRADGSMVVYYADQDPYGAEQAKVKVIVCGSANVATGPDGIDRVVCANASPMADACR